MSIMGSLGNVLGGVSVPGRKETEGLQAYQNKDMRNLGDKSAKKAGAYLDKNPFGKDVEAASRAEGKAQIEKQRQASAEDISEKGTKVGYSSGLMDKLKNNVNRQYDDAAIEESRRSKLDFIGRKVGFDMDLLDKTNQMAQFGSEQATGNLWNRLAQKQAQTEAGWKGLSRISNMVGSAMSGGAMPMMG